MIEKIALHVKPINGPFSYYLNWRETSILTFLVASVAPKVMIEFGTNVGITASRILCNVPTLERYIGIDVPSDYAPTLRCQDSEVPAHPGCFVTDPRYWLLIAEHELTHDDLEPCDACFIDGDHSDQGVTHDSELARELIRPGGMIVWHDYQNGGVEVTRALDRFSDHGWPIKHVEGSWLAFMKT